MVCRGVGIDYKVALFEQLVVVLLGDAVLDNRCMEFVAERTLDLDCLYLEAVGVEQVTEIAFLRRGVLHGKQTVVETCLCVQARVALHPVDSGFGLAVAALGARLGSRVVGGIDGGDIALGVLVAAGGLDDIRRFEAHLTPARTETEEILVRLLEEVAALDIEFAGELHLARAEFGVSVDVLCGDSLAVSLVVGDNEFHGGEDGADTRCGLFEALADGMLQQTDINHSLHLGVTDTVDERKEMRHNKYPIPQKYSPRLPLSFPFHPPAKQQG